MTEELQELQDLQELVIPDAAALRAWLAGQHATSPRVWLALTRKGGTTTTLAWQQAVDEALCFGWIDGQARKRDEQTSCVTVHPYGMLPPQALDLGTTGAPA